MPLPDFHDRRPYIHPEHPGTWRISAIGPYLITMRMVTFPQDTADRPARCSGTTDVPIALWPGPWTLIEDSPERSAEHEEIAPGIYRLTDEHRVYAVPSTSTDRIHQVTVNTRTGAMRCDGPHCDARTCSHQKRVRAARAGF